MVAAPAALTRGALPLAFGPVGTLCYIGAMRPVRGFFFGYFWFSSAPGGREI
jgi:hypothetical protein